MRNFTENECGHMGICTVSVKRTKDSPQWTKERTPHPGFQSDDRKFKVKNCALIYSSMYLSIYSQVWVVEVAPTILNILHIRFLFCGIHYHIFKTEMMWIKSCFWRWWTDVHVQNIDTGDFHKASWTDARTSSTGCF